VDGLRERWGKDVVHCPYCHGWEVRDRRIAVLASGPLAAHQGLLFSQLSKDVVVLANGQNIDAADRDKLAARGVEVIEGGVVEVLVDDDAIVGLQLEGGRVVACDVVTASSQVHARSTVLQQLGLEPVPLEGVDEVGSYFPADATGRTTLDGVWAAGNVTLPMGQVVQAAAAGAMAGAAINMDLIEEEISVR
jgi:thioredoxin reductase